VRTGKIALVGVGILVVLLGAAIAFTPARHAVADYVPELAERVAESRSNAPAAPVADLTDLSQLEAAFNAGAGSPRLIMLISPT
jgi:hypothetical protein